MFKRMLRQLVTSKKFLATVAGAVYASVGHRLGASADQIAEVVGLLAAYVVGQGVSDAGKGKAQLERGE